MDKRLIGRWGEQVAGDYLKKKHYKIVAMNFSCRGGEIDLIAENRKYIVFVEVKLRKNADFAQAKEFAAHLNDIGYFYTDRPVSFDLVESFNHEELR